MPCLIKHRWVTLWEQASLWDKTFNSIPAHRKCKRCGIMQIGILDGLKQVIAWETLREHTFVQARQVRIDRKPSSRLDQLAHSLGLRRSRTTDAVRSGNRSVQT